MTTPTEAFPIRKGQTWRDRDKRSPFQVRIIDVSDARVYYQRLGHRVYSTDLLKFSKRFDFVSNPRV